MTIIIATIVAGVFWIIGYLHGRRDVLPHEKMSVQERASWISTVDRWRLLADGAWARAYVWQGEVMKLNKALRRYRRHYVRNRDEHRAARKQIQAQAPSQAQEQAAATKERPKSRVQVRRSAREAGQAPEGVAGVEGV